MRKKLETLWMQARMAILGNPVEVLLAVLASGLGCYQYGQDGREFDMYLHYFPILFLFTYTLNQCCEKGRIRLVYYLSVSIGVAFLLMTDGWRFSTTYLISLVVVQLVYLVSRRQPDNEAFVQTGLHYLKSLFSASVLAGVTFLLSLSIFFSIRYIFEIWESQENRFIESAAYVVFYGILPLLFLMFNDNKEREEWLGSRLFGMLLNYILSPALLIYAGILYLYFIKIALLWSLPKGGVAYIVVSFTTVTFILKGCQVFLTRRYYDWFFNHASIVVMPALVMYWVGSLYRIREYGFTEDRVYLVVVGLILTGVAFLFFSKRWGRYLFGTYWAIGWLAVVTYIPGITAQDIERISQAGREHTLPEDLYAPEYVELSSNKPIDIQGYRSMVKITNYGTDEDAVRLNFTGDSLSFQDSEGTILYGKTTDEFLDGQLTKAGLTRRDTIPKAAYPEFLQIDLDSGKIVLESINFMRDSVYHINYVYGQVYLKR